MITIKQTLEQDLASPSQCLYIGKNKTVTSTFVGQRLGDPYLRSLYCQNTYHFWFSICCCILKNIDWDILVCLTWTSSFLPLWHFVPVGYCDHYHLPVCLSVQTFSQLIISSMYRRRKVKCYLTMSLGVA